ncbi:hypothetical protein [Cryobacterium sp. Hb1]|uniref:hypothetical protein n=1 Tax=Cryobacterium sp. Hb1 TaxID=1259147 RepID=UPI0010692FFB|nr:hypothetical protein [Cryobacterium sp. Hb1]TFD70433.1 hypothetical protein E3T38_05170 [Cryobacterium sp. Hb1]
MKSLRTVLTAGRTMVSLLRRVHAGVPGTDDDFLYVLISLLIAPLRWLDSHGWRAVEPTSFPTWCAVGTEESWVRSLATCG